MRRGDQVLHQDSYLYGAPVCPQVLGVLEDDPHENPEGASRYPYTGQGWAHVRFGDGVLSYMVVEGPSAEVRPYGGGNPAALRTDEEQSDIDRLEGAR